MTVKTVRMRMPNKQKAVTDCWFWRYLLSLRPSCLGFYLTITDKITTNWNKRNLLYTTGGRGSHPTKERTKTVDSILCFPWFPRFLLHCQKQPRKFLKTKQIDVIVMTAPRNQLQKMIDMCNDDPNWYCGKPKADLGRPTYLNQILFWTTQKLTNQHSRDSMEMSCAHRASSVILPN